MWRSIFSLAGMTLTSHESNNPLKLILFKFLLEIRHSTRKSLCHIWKHSFWLFGARWQVVHLAIELSHFRVTKLVKMFPLQRHRSYSSRFKPQRLKKFFAIKISWVKQSNRSNLVKDKKALKYYLYSFLNGPFTASFSFIFGFGLFKQTSMQFLQQINVRNVHPDSNPQPLGHEPPITTRPVLPSKNYIVCLSRKPFDHHSIQLAVMQPKCNYCFVGQSIIQFFFF